MSRHTAIKTALVIGFVVSAAVDLLGSWSDLNYHPPAVTLGMLAFGLFNVLVEPGGTLFVRTVAIVCSLIALVTNQTASAFMLLLAWLIWPPAYLASWAMSHAGDDPDRDDDSSARRARVVTASVIAAAAVSAIAFRLLVRNRLDQSAALFVGIPALLAIVAVFSPTPRSAVGVACKAVTIGLLISLIFLGEGMLCIAMSAPLFYLVAILVGKTFDRLRANPLDSRGKILSSIALLALVPMSLEGVTPSMSLDREMSISETTIVQASAAAVEQAIANTPRFDRPLPYYLRAGFPRPAATRIVGPVMGGAAAHWIITMRGGEMRLDGMEPRSGDLVLTLDESRPGLVRWRVQSDDSHMTHFLDWRSSQVTWQAINAHETRVTWTLGYRRRLDPAWYFGPMEEYATRLAARYLIASVATP